VRRRARVFLISTPRLRLAGLAQCFLLGSLVTRRTRVEAAGPGWCRLGLGRERRGWLWGGVGVYASWPQNQRPKNVAMSASSRR
jgi:hypothetical protein